MFGSCPSANSLEDALGKINLVTAEDTNEPMSIQFQEDVNSIRLDQIETTEETQHRATAETNLTLSCDEELEQICFLAIPDRNQQTDDRRTLLREFRDVFAMNDNELGQTHLVQHEIDTGDTLPIKLAPHRLLVVLVLLNHS